jgi:hypothetical protein
LLYKRHGIDSNQFASLPNESDMSRTSTVPHDNTVFQQLAKQLPHAALDRSIEQHRADKGVRKLPTKQLLLVMLLAQVSGTRSLRDLPALLESHSPRLYHAGLPRAKRSTLSDALALRPHAVFAEALATLIPRLSGKLARGVGDCVRLIDSTTVQLNRLGGEWARFSADFHGAKAHVVLDPDANCPLYLSVTPAKVNDITAAKEMPIDRCATYVFDLGYYDFGWWAKLDEACCRIVTRMKANTKLDVIETLAVPEDATNVVSDRIGFLPERMARSRKNPMRNAVREVKVEIKPGTTLRLLTNDLDAPASEIAALYKRRWDIELFFRWVKQMLKLRHFFGVSENAVRIQIAVAMIAFVLIRLAHEGQHAVTCLTTFARLVAANVLHRMPLKRMRTDDPPPDPPESIVQGVLL